jgi:hypothetical protein
MFKWQLISAGLIKAFADVLQFANPLLLKKLLEFVSDPSKIFPIFSKKLLFYRCPSLAGNFLCYFNVYCV